jgi:hypothetical protein
VGSVATPAALRATGIEAIPRPVADLRPVPLDELPGDRDALDLVDEVLATALERSGIGVAKFNSAI